MIIKSRRFHKALIKRFPEQAAILVQKLNGMRLNGKEPTEEQKISLEFDENDERIWDFLEELINESK